MCDLRQLPVIRRAVLLGKRLVEQAHACMVVFDDGTCTHYAGSRERLTEDTATLIMSPYPGLAYAICPGCAAELRLRLEKRGENLDDRVLLTPQQITAHEAPADPTRAAA